jgi:predicted RNA-binding Zn-ribbon protein involved in translation (DUF1610 family)
MQNPLSTPATLQGQGMRVNCPQCGTPFNAAIESLIDAGHDPNAKARFLSRRTNVFQCPRCGAVVQLAVPLVYHDHTKELMLVFFPMELNIPKVEREKIIGEMSRAVMNSLPQELRKGYLFNPIEALTLDGMVETVLQKDGITPQMIAAQKEKMRLVELLMSAPPDQRPALIQQHDATIDDEFFQLMSLSVDSAFASGREDVAEALVEIQNQLLNGSTYGKYAGQRIMEQQAAIEAVAQRLEKMGQQIEVDAFVDYVFEVSDNDDYLQAIVGLARTIVTPNLLNYISQKAALVKDEALKAQYQQAVQRMQELNAEMTQREQAVVQQAQQIIGALLNAPDMEQAVEQNLGAIDDTLLQILVASIQHYEKQRDLLNAARLKKLYETIMDKLEADAPPELQFINELMRMEDTFEAKLTLSDHAQEFGPSLVKMMDVVLENLQSRGGGPLAERLAELRQDAAKIVGEP